MSILFSLTLILFTGSRCVAHEFYVATNGKDSNPGSKVAPFKSLKQARDAVRSLKQSSEPKEATTIWIREGDYQLTKSFTLTAKDSGSEKFSIQYRAMPGEQVRFSGGIKLSSSQFRAVLNRDLLKRFPAETRAHVVQISLESLGIDDLKKPLPNRFQGYAGWPELFCNHEPMKLARWPNKGFASIKKVLDKGTVPRKGEKGKRGGTFQYEGTRPSRWLNAEAVHLKGYWCFKWSSETIRAAKIDPRAKTITLSEPHTYGIGGPSGGFYVAINLLEELDEPGEYFIDRKNKKLYFWPPAPMRKCDVQLSLLNKTMIVLDGASHTTFRDITFENSRENIFEIKNNASRNLIAGCTFRNLAKGAVSIQGGLQNGVKACDFYNLGGGGVTMKGGDRNKLTPCKHFVENCHFHHFGRLYRTYAPAIRLDGVGCKVAHNLIHTAPHMAISFMGNEHLIELNEIHHVCSETDDAGAIYTGRDWTTYGTVIRYNHFHHIGGDAHVGNQAIYVDDVGGGITCYGNVIRHTYRAFLMGGGRDLIMRNNILIDCNISFHIDNRGLTWAGKGKENWVTTTRRLKAIPYNKEPWLSKYPQLSRYLDEDPGAPIRNEVTRNLVVRCQNWRVHEIAREKGTVENNYEAESEIINGKKLFLEADKDDYTTPKDSPVFSKIKGFEAIPFHDIGLVVDQYRENLPLRPPLITPVSANAVFGKERNFFVDSVQLQILPHSNPASMKNIEVRYTLDGSKPDENSQLYLKPITLQDSLTLQAIVISRHGNQIEKSVPVIESFTAYQLGTKNGISLTELSPTDSKAHGNLKIDCNLDGSKPVKLGKKNLQHSIFLHPMTTATNSQSHATFQLSGPLQKANRFEAIIGISDFTKSRGSVKFMIEIYRGGSWQKIYTSELVKGNPSHQPVRVSVDISGAKQLRLICTNGGDNPYSDHAVWGNPILK